MKSIVDALNKKTGENAKTVVEALKDVDPNATGNTIAEVIETMEIGGGGGGESNIPTFSFTVRFAETIVEDTVGYNDVFEEGFTAIRVVDENGIVRQIDETGEFSKDETYRELYLAEYDLGGILAVCIPTSYVTISNLVNCEIFSPPGGEGLSFLVITDPSKDSSATFFVDFGR